MSKPADVHAFFSKLAASMGSATEKPSLKMLHTKQAVASRSDCLHDIVASSSDFPAFFAVELNDFGVGLPPLAQPGY